MSYGIAVKTLDGLDLDGNNTNDAPHLAGGQDWFLVEGQPVVIHNDPVTPHLPPLPIEHIAPVMNQDASTWMDLDGIPVIREGNLANCLHPSTGRDWFVLPD